MTDHTEMSRGGQGRVRRVRLTIAAGAVAVAAVAAGVAAWAFAGEDDKPAAGPVALSAEGLATLAGALGQPVYWIGPRPNTRYEVRQADNGTVTVRYLPGGARPGDPRPLTSVVTRPLENAFRETRARAEAEGVVRVDVGNAGVGYYERNDPTHAYAAFPEVRYQIEVYAPTPGVARRLLAAKRVRAVAGA